MNLARLLTPDQQRLLDALADQAALAIERVNLASDVDRARLVAETDRLRAALLTSISHDLRTPLASILGSATSLATQGDALDAATRLDLVRTIQDEAERLNRFIGNLLDMTRLESGPLQLRTGAVDLSDVDWPARCGVPGKSSRRTGRRSSWSLTCRCSSWTTCCSSRCCSICWTMPANTLRPDR